MHARVSTAASSVLVALSIVVAGCDDNNSNGMVGSSPTGPSVVQARGNSITVEPAILAPEFLTSPFCTAPVFSTRFALFLPVTNDAFLQSMRFQFLDRAGRLSLPVVTATTHPVQTPAFHPIPIPTPGSLPFYGIPLSATSNRVGLLVNFGCGVTAAGTLSIDVETTNGNGAPNVSHVTARVEQ